MSAPTSSPPPPPVAPSRDVPRPDAPVALNTHRGVATPPAVTLGPDHTIDCALVETLSLAPFACDYSDAAIERMQASIDTLHAARDAGQPIYGMTTGFGPFVSDPADASPCVQGAALVEHLGAGWGAWASPEVVRATMLIRMQSMAQGCSGVSVEIARRFAMLAERDVIAAVPEVGSVGASGDLIPMAHIVRAMSGVGTCLDMHAEQPRLQTIPAMSALSRAGLEPAAAPARDALGIVNGTAFMAAYAALALARADRLIARAESLTGWMYRLLGCRAQALDARAHAARGHAGQARSAANIRAEAFAFGAFEDDRRPLQEVYSLRCAPQFLGACREQLDHARRLIETEINNVSDNPVVWPGLAGVRADHAIAHSDVAELTEQLGEAAVLHAGNFQGQQIGFAADAINAAVTQIGVLIERQIDALATPEINGGAPLLLAETPGRDAGLAGAQITATALTAELRAHSRAHANDSLPTNGRNQDVVSMGTKAARIAFEQTDRLAGVLAIGGIATAQLNALRQRGRAEGRTTPAPAWMPSYEPFVHDRALEPDIRRVSAAMLTPDQRAA